MTKTELLHGLTEYKDQWQSSTGIANIIQLVIDILVDDMEHDAKKYKPEVSNEKD